MGMDVPTSAKLLVVTSRIEYLFLADRIPMGIAITKESARPSNWSSRVSQVRCAIKSETETPWYKA